MLAWYCTTALYKTTFPFLITKYITATASHEQNNKKAQLTDATQHSCEVMCNHKDNIILLLMFNAKDEINHSANIHPKHLSATGAAKQSNILAINQVQC